LLHHNFEDRDRLLAKAVNLLAAIEDRGSINHRTISIDDRFDLSKSELRPRLANRFECILLFDHHVSKDAHHRAIAEFDIGI
jgi:hypothetical protein